MCLVCEKNNFSNEAIKPSWLLEHLQKIHPDKSGKTLAFFHSLRYQFLKRKTMNIFTSSSKNSDDGLKASYNISLLIAKAGKPHTIGEELILSAVKAVIKTVLHKSPEQVIKSISFSDNSVQRRVDKIAEKVEEALSKMLMTTEFSLQLDESTFPGNESLLLASSRVGHCVTNYCLHVSWKQIPKENQCIELWRTISRKKHSTYKHDLMCYRWRPVHGWSPPWISKLFEKSCSESPLSSLCDPSTILSAKEFEWETTWIHIDCDYCSQQSECSQFSTVRSAVYWKWRRFSMSASLGGCRKVTV